MALSTDFMQAQTYLSQDAAAAQVFKFILRRSAANGWMIVKELGQDTDQTENSLNKLRQLGVLEGEGTGLDGYYHSSSLGYALREALSM